LRANSVGSTSKAPFLNKIGGEFGLASRRLDVYSSAVRISVNNCNTGKATEKTDN